VIGQRGKDNRRGDVMLGKTNILFCLYAYINVFMYVYGYRGISVDGCIDLDNIQGGSPFIKFIIFKSRHGCDFKIVRISAKAAINILLTKLHRISFMWASKNFKKGLKPGMTARDSINYIVPTRTAQKISSFCCSTIVA
jgi:hypothetical protein